MPQIDQLLNMGRPAKVSVAYFLMSASYIVGSGYLFSHLLDYSEATLRAETLKGLGFVTVTTMILWFVLYRESRARAMSEVTFRELVENLRDAVFVLRLPERTISYANPAAEAMFGYGPPELIGANTEVLHVSPEHFIEFDSKSAPILLAGRPYQADFEMRRKNGEVFPTSHIVTAFSDHGHGSYALSVVHDRSLRRAYEDRLRESEARFRQIAENLREVFWVSDRNKTRMEYVSPAYAEIWGRRVEELYRDPASFLTAVHSDDHSFVEEQVGKQADGHYDIQYRIVRPNGEIRWIWDRAAPVRDDDGNIYRIVGVAEDITQMKVQEAELLRAQKTEALGQLTGGIAHDFNNILTIILGNAELMEDIVPEGSRARAHLEKIRRAGEEAGGLTRRLLTFAREQAFEPDTLDPNRLVLDTIKLLGRTLGEHVSIETGLTAEVWPITVDKAFLESSIMNLAINARDAMPEGGTLTIESANRTFDEPLAGAGHTAPPGDYVMISVSDTGTGMDAGTAERVFDPFFTTKAPDRGTGLGLSMVHGFVLQSGGHMELRTTPGQGTTFRIYLPRSHAEARIGPNAEAATPGGSERILVVEDDSMVRAFLADMLGKLGYTTIGAGNGEEAIEKLGSDGDIALLITDVVMPGGMSGPRLAAKARRWRPEVKVLFMSGYGESTEFAKEGWATETRIIRKPFKRSEMARLIRNILDGQG